MLTLKQGFEKMGHSVYVFTTRHPSAPKDEPRVYRVPSISFRVRRLGTFLNLRLKSKIKKLNLELIHINTEFSLGLFGRSVARSLNIPIVHTMHTIYEDYTHYVIKSNLFAPFIKKLAKKYTAYFCNSADIVIVPSNKVMVLLSAYGVKKDINIIPTGINLQKFSSGGEKDDTSRLIRDKLGITENEKILINIGRVSKEKNLIEILAAMRIFLPLHPGVRFLLVGDGPELNILKKTAADMDLNGRVIFTGERPWDEIGIYYRAGDIFIAASQSETQGLTYFEALASGLPIIAKYDPCLDGVIRNGENGYTFTETDEFLKLLENNIYNEPELKRLSDGAYKTAAEFSDAGFAEAVYGIYQEALNRKKVSEIGG